MNNIRLNHIKHDNICMDIQYKGSKKKTGFSPRISVFVLAVFTVVL